MRGEERFLFALAKGQCGDEHLAQDAVQETLLVAWRKLSTLSDPASLRSWLGTTLIRKCGEIRTRHRSGQHAPLTLEPAAGEPRSDDDPPGQERRAALAEALRSLSDEHQMVVAMHYSEGLDYRQIADRLGITEDAVRGRLFQAREKLRAKLKGRLT
jgi:RNA polymerase sigma-70 factor (ECF subfamily)